MMRRFIWGIGSTALVVMALALTLVIQTPAEAQVLGTGWVGTFYNNTTFSEPSAASNISYPVGLRFNWGAGSPTDGAGVTIPGVNADNFSAVFTSTQLFNAVGTYTFTIFVNDGVRVSIDNQVYVNQLTPFNNATPNAFQTLTFQYTRATPGSATVRVDFVEFSGDANLVFQWSIPGSSGGGGGGVVPTFGPTPTAVPIATGSVITVRGLALRTGPYLGASMVGVIRPNVVYPILEKNFDEGLFPWYKIQDGNRIGWASGRYLIPTGNLDLIPSTQTIFDRIDNPTDLPPALNIVGYTRSVMNLRRRPSERTQLLNQIPWGDGVQIIGRTVQGGQNFWLQVRWEGQVGWIYAPFVTIEGLIEAVPIR